MEEVKITWSKDEPLEMASQAKHTVTEMTGNSNYTSPDVPLPDMDDAADLVIAKYPTRNGTELQKQAFKDAVVDLDDLLHKQARYINEKSEGDRTKIISGGWTPTATTRSRSVITDKVEVLKLKPIGGGVLKVHAKKPIGCDKLFYVIYTGEVVDLIIRGTQFIIPDNARGVQIVANGRQSMRLTGFSDFAKVSIVAYSINAAGISPPSGVFSTKIL